MKIKGTSILNTIAFVKNNFPESYDDWINELPEEISEVFKGIIFSSHWYDFDTVYLVPIQIISQKFYNNDYVKGAHEIGKASAIKALNGIYKIFVKIASIDFVIKRSTSIFSTYYEKPAKLDVVKSEKDEIIVEVFGFTKKQSLVFDAIVGWLDGLFSIIIKRKYHISYRTKDKNKNDIIAIISIKFD